MKVALIDNTNNNFFNVTRYLRDKGIDAHLLLNDSLDAHFHPSADCYDLSYQEYTRQLNWGSQWSLYKTSKKEIINDLKEFDFIISCGYIPAFLEKAKLRNFIFIPYGMDLYQYPFHSFKFDLGSLYLGFKYFQVNTFQKRGIKNSRNVVCCPTNEEFSKYFEKLKLQNKMLFLGIPMIYTPQYNPVSIQTFFDFTHWHKEFLNIRRSYDLVIFHHSRQMWKNPINKINNKGNDILINGFADFVKNHKSINACLILLEYGVDVYESKKLISELNIEKHVKWFPLMTRKDLMIGIYYSDIVAGEFKNSWLTYGVIYESLAMAKPILHNRNDELYKNFYPELYPMIHSSSQEEVNESLSKFIDNQKKFNEIGEKGRVWLQKFLIDDAVNSYVELIQKP